MKAKIKKLSRKRFKNFFKQMGFTLHKPEQQLQQMKLQKLQEDESWQKNSP